MPILSLIQMKELVALSQAYRCVGERNIFPAVFHTYKISGLFKIFLMVILSTVIHT